MIIKRTLKSQVCPVVGEYGFFIEGMDLDKGLLCSTNVDLLLHDLLDHVNGPENIGTIADELEAEGSYWYSRGQFGDGQRSRFFTPYEIANRSIINLSDEMKEKNETISCDPVPETDYDDDIEVIFEGFESFNSTAKNLFRSGIIKTEKMFGDPLTANNFYHELKNNLEKYFDYPEEFMGISLLVSFNTKDLRSIKVKEKFLDE